MPTWQYCTEGKLLFESLTLTLTSQINNKFVQSISFCERFVKKKGSTEIEKVMKVTVNCIGLTDSVFSSA